MSEQKLWRKVLVQGIKDACSLDPATALEARGWFDTKDFRAVCRGAGLAPEEIREVVGQILSTPDRGARAYYVALLAQRLLPH